MARKEIEPIESEGLIMREKFQEELAEGCGLNETEIGMLISGLQLLYDKEAASFPKSRFLKMYRRLTHKLASAV